MKSNSEVANTLENEFCSFVQYAIEASRAFPSLRSKEDKLSAALAAFRKTFNVAIVGRLKQGKSTIMNALVGEPIAPTGVTPTTATINFFQYGTGSPVVKYLDGREESISPGDLSRWVGDAPEVLDRIKTTQCIQFYSKAEPLKGMSLVDTPGTESGIGEHDDIARAFLTNAAAIVYVTQYPGRDEDLRTLRKHQGESSMASRALNSVCLLHKWEEDLTLVAQPELHKALEERATCIKNSLQGAVQVVLPLSGALALCVRYAPEEWWTDILQFCSTTSHADIITALGSNDERWNRDANRADLWMRVHQSPLELNFNTFRLIIRQILHHSLKDTRTAKSHLLELSGMDRLETLIKEKFFGRQSQIKLDQLCKLTAPVFDSAMLQFTKDLDHAELGKQCIETLRGRTDLSRNEQIWLEKESRIVVPEVSAYVKARDIFDVRWNELKVRIEDSQLDLRTLEEYLDDPASKLSPEDRRILEDVVFHPRKKCTDATRKTHRRLVGEFRELANSAPRKMVDIYEHIYDRLNEALSQNLTHL